MEEKDKELVARLIRENEEFARLYKDHEEYEEKLDELEKFHYLTAEQEISRKNIQKLKLKGKDRMEEILRDFRNN